MLVVILLLAGFASANGGWFSCELTKEQSGKCAMDKCDFDRDGKLSELEVLFVFEEVLTGLSRFAAMKVTSPSIAIDHCGDPATGYVTQESFRASDKCIEHCFEKKMFKRLVCDVLDATDGMDEIAQRYKDFALANYDNPVLRYKQKLPWLTHGEEQTTAVLQDDPRDNEF